MLRPCRRNRSTVPSLLACAAYALLLVAFWFVARHFAMEARIQGHMASSFTAFALLLAPYWFFGFGAAGMLQRFLTNRAVRVLIPGLLLVPYLIFSVPRGEFRWVYAVVLFSIPVAIAALFEFLPPGGVRPAIGKLCWQDVVALAVVGLPVEFGWIARKLPTSRAKRAAEDPAHGFNPLCVPGSAPARRGGLRFSRPRPRRR